MDDDDMSSRSLVDSIEEEKSIDRTKLPIPVGDVGELRHRRAGITFEKFNILMDDEKKPSSPPHKVAISGMNLLSSNLSRVEKSWLIISEHNRIGAVGSKFFLRMLEEYPELVHLFPFGQDSLDKTGKLKLNAHTRKHVQAHASAVMRVVGTCVAGLTSMEELIPRLRSVGATHKVVGVQNMHYDILYRHLIRAIREEVGPENWDEETEDAWEQAYLSITDLIKRPSKRLETEPLHGWGAIMLVACTYFTLVTPVRFAGFYIGRRWVIYTLDNLDTVAAAVVGFDLLIDLVQSKFQLNTKKPWMSTKYRGDSVSETTNGEASSHKSHDSASSVAWFRKGWNQVTHSIQTTSHKIHRNGIKRLHRWNMDRWVPWPGLDVKVLLSFVLQRLFFRGSLCAQLGLHWTQLFGLLRLSCASRVLHFVQCAENNALLGQQLDSDRQLLLRVVKLLVRLAFITHVSACMWCAVARVELGVDATEFTASSFFPDPSILSRDNGRNVFNSYSRAIYWAFVNLSGIGGVESVPVSSLECWLVLIVHMIGAIFYAIVTGNVITVLEESAQDENKIGSDIAKLSNYLKTARVSDKSQERIMKGYMMRNVLTQNKDSAGPALDGLLDANDQVLRTLPNYLRAEVGIYARAETIRRRVPLFMHCSKGFLVALSGALSSGRTLLTGDYLVKKGEQYAPEVIVVENGNLQIREDDATTKTIKRGDCIGKSWLLQRKLQKDHIATVSIRALSPCVLVTGLSTIQEVDRLERAYPVDFKMLRAELRGRHLDESTRQEVALAGIAKAVRRFKERKIQKRRTSDESQGIFLA